MEKWKVISLIVRCLVAANVTVIAGVLAFQLSRPAAIKAMMAFRVSALALLLLVPAEYILRRRGGARGYGLLVDALLSLLMFGVWFTISAATF